MKTYTKDKKMLAVFLKKTNPDRLDILVVRARDGKHGHFAIKNNQELHFVKPRGFIKRIRKKINGKETVEFESLSSGKITRTLKIVTDLKGK